MKKTAKQTPPVFDDQRRSTFRAISSTLIVILTTLPFMWIWFQFVSENNITGHLLGKGNLFMAIGIYAILIIAFFHFFGAFRIGTNRASEVFASQILGVFLVNLTEILISMAITGQVRFWDNFLALYFMLTIFQVILLLIYTKLAVTYYVDKFPPMEVLEIYGSYVNHLAEKINDRSYLYRVKGRMSADSSMSQIESVIPGYDAVLINDVESEKKNDIIKFCYGIDKRVYFTPKISDILTRSASVLNLFDTPIYVLTNGRRWVIQSAIKRAFDFLLSLFALVILSPLLLFVAIAIKVNDGGPIFYKQKRATLGGKTFEILKFRSMIVDAEKDGKSRPAKDGDDRITKVGRWIRPTRMDELPQLINILKGDMSLVGPRPERLEHVEKYSEEIPEFIFRNKVRGGLTGYAQVYGKYNTTPLDKLKLDLMYIQSWSLLLDFQLIVETVKVIFKPESTEGFSEEDSQKIHDLTGK